MSCVVLKFGGTSVANIARLQHSATIVKKEILSGNHVVVVVSAMAGVTNQYNSYLAELSSDSQTSEHDVVLSSGEQVTAGLMALSLQKLGFKSRSYLSWQIPILTNISHTNAKITHIPTDEITKCLKSGMIPVVAGFQGISNHGRITTLGRGGSDTTAVALAASLKAKRCDIYTDVDGVYTADPRIIPDAKRLPVISYDEMFEMSVQGAKVLQPKSVEIAIKNKVSVRVLSSFVEGEGTYIVKKRIITKGHSISGIAHSENEVKILIKEVENDIDVTSKILTPLAEKEISVDSVVHSYNENNRINVTFTVSINDQKKTLSLLKKLQNSLEFSEITIDEDIAKISVVGIGLKNKPDNTNIIFQTLANENINIQLISTSNLKIGIVIHKKHMIKAIQALHKALHLDNIKKRKVA